MTPRCECDDDDAHPIDCPVHPHPGGRPRRAKLERSMAALDGVLIAARRVECGCDCEQEYRCPRCDAVLSLKIALARYDERAV